jgi:hypothetical protein
MPSHLLLSSTGEKESTLAFVQKLFMQFATLPSGLGCIVQLAFLQ